MTTYYEETIGAVLATINRLDVDPRHVEAFMRNEHPTLDAIGPAAFIEELCIDEAGPGEAEALAKSFGLGKKKK